MSLKAGFSGPPHPSHTVVPTPGCPGHPRPSQPSVQPHGPKQHLLCMFSLHQEHRLRGKPSNILVKTLRHGERLSEGPGNQLSAEHAPRSPAHKAQQATNQTDNEAQ